MTPSPTFISPLLPRGVVKLQVDLAVLSSLCSVLAVCCSLVGFVVNLSAECMGELFCGTAAFLTQIVALPEVLAQVLIITVGSRVQSKRQIIGLVFLSTRKFADFFFLLQKITN